MALLSSLAVCTPAGIFVTATLEVIFVMIILAEQFLSKEYLSRFVFTLMQLSSPSPSQPSPTI